MKTKALANAVVACIAMTAGIVPDAQAMNLNPMGSGQVLIYPYYTVNAGNQTLISVVNKTDQGKAIRVRFREGRNARSVLDFNLYLSPFDVWTASAFSLSDTGPNNPGNLITFDNSCTVPAIKGNTALPVLANGARYAPFLNFSYTGTTDDAGPDTLDRSREGYFELIEMGEVVDRERTSLTAITHSGGVPNNCLLVQRAWLPGTAGATIAYWTFNQSTDIAPPKGGLFGTASIIDALGGTMMSYDAEAIDGFSDIVQHESPGTISPSLANARTTAGTAAAQVFSKGALVTSTYPIAQAIDAVSALFVQDEVFNEFATSASAGAASEWVVTFPTKYAYSDQELVGVTAIAPFTRIFPRAVSSTNSGTAAVDFEPTLFDREEGPPRSFCPPRDPNCCGFLCPPLPPIPQLMWSSNVVAFNQPMSATNPSVILGSRLAINEQPSDVGVLDGWASYRFYAATGIEDSLIQSQRMRPDQNGGRWNGLPVIGFAATSFTNGQLTPGVLSNYAGAAKHRGSNAYGTAP
jgi:hypothetical protein